MKKAIIYVLTCVLGGMLLWLVFGQWTNGTPIEMRHLEALEQNNIALQRNLTFPEEQARNVLILLQNRIADDGRAPTLSVIEEASQVYQLNYTIQQEIKKFERMQKLDIRTSLTAPMEKIAGSTPQLDTMLKRWHNRYQQYVQINQWLDSSWSPFSLQTSVRLIKQTELLAIRALLASSHHNLQYLFVIKIQGCGYCIPNYDLRLIPRSRIVTEGSTWEATLLLTAGNIGFYSRSKPFIELASYKQTLQSKDAQVHPVANKPAYTVSFIAQKDSLDNQDGSQNQWSGTWQVHPRCLTQEEMDTTFLLSIPYTVKKK